MSINNKKYLKPWKEISHHVKDNDNSGCGACKKQRLCSKKPHK